VAVFAAAGFDMAQSAALAVDHARLGRTIGRLPSPVLHRLVSTLARAETWLRWPLRTLHTLDFVDETFQRIDPDGSRFGLTPEVRKRFRRNLLYDGFADLAVLVNKIDSPSFRRQALTVEGEEVFRQLDAAHPGAIVAGFRLGGHPVLPLVLGALGYDTLMIVAGAHLVQMGESIGRSYAPLAASRISYVDARDRFVLARATEALNSGRIVSTLAELSPLRFEKTTEVRFLDWTIRVPYGIPYLSAVTGRPMIPAVLTATRGARYRLRFLKPLPAPLRDRASIFAATQALYDVLDEQVRLYPEQWVGWPVLESHLGIDLGPPAPELVATVP
jgi:lauroyl/myristoyl acyltransferase